MTYFVTQELPHCALMPVCCSFPREMWWVLCVLAALLVLFCSLDVWYFLRVAVVILRAWFQPRIRDITAEQTLRGRVTPHDIDMCHMNNARYLRECDFARFSLYTRNGVFKALQELRASVVVGATTIRYRRALCIGEGYELRSRIVTWDDKAFYLEQRFVSTKDQLVCAVMYCKQSVIRSSPDKIMQHLCKRKVRNRHFNTRAIFTLDRSYKKALYICWTSSLWFAPCRWSALSFQRTSNTGSTSSPLAARPSGLRVDLMTRTDKSL